MVTEHGCPKMQTCYGKGTSSYYPEEGRLSEVERVQYVSKFDVLSRSFTQCAIDGALHHPAPFLTVAPKTSTPISQTLEKTESKYQDVS